MSLQVNIIDNGQVSVGIYLIDFILVVLDIRQLLPPGQSAESSL